MEELVKAYFGDKKTLTQEDVITFLKDKEYYISEKYERRCHEDDVRDYLYDEDICNPSANEVAELCDLYEKYLSNDGSWWNCLMEAYHDIYS